jgi:SAM-dependent methyltransferase
MWNDSAGYEAYVGRWSRALAPRFLAWLQLSSRLKWLDVACGTAAVTAAIVRFCDPEEVVGLDSSADYLDAARGNCPDPRARFLPGDATALPFPSATFDVSISGLALNFIPYDRSLAEQRRVVRSGGMIAAYVWDYAGEYEFARRFWDTALSIDPRAAAYDPGRKAAICSEKNLASAFLGAGCTRVETAVLDETGEFPSREDYWHAFDGRQGSTAEYLSMLTDEMRTRLRDTLLSAMNPTGPVRLKLRALAVKGFCD